MYCFLNSTLSRLKDSGIRFPMEPFHHIFRELALVLALAALAGLVAKRMGLSPVIGFLGTGLILGLPDLPEFAQISRDSIGTLAAIGISMLMFSIGLSVRFHRLRSLGPAGVGTAILAVLMLISLIRTGAGLASWSPLQALAIATLFIFGSPTLAGRFLREHGLMHERSGRLAQGIFQTEAFIALGVLSFIVSLVSIDQIETHSLQSILGTLGIWTAFVVTAVIFGIIVLPGLLRSFSKAHSKELKALIIAGLLFALSYLAAKAGFVVSLGAFLFGLIAAGTRERREIEDSFSTLRYISATIFFVAVAMLVDLSSILKAGPWIAAGCFVTLILRPAMIALALVVFCETPRTALRTAALGLPVAEWTLLLALWATVNGVLPPEFLTASVIVTIITCVAAPVAHHHLAHTATLLTKLRWNRGSRYLAAYHRIWRGLGEKQEASTLWKLLRFRIIQIVVEVTLITALLVFSEPLYEGLREYSRKGHEVWEHLLPYYWLGYFGFVLIPTLAVWRNLQAISMIIAGHLTRRVRGTTAMRSGLTFGLQLVSVSLLLVWLVNFLPMGIIHGWLLLSVILFSVLFLLLGYRRMTRWHSEWEYSVQSTLTEQPSKAERDWDEAGKAWGLILYEQEVPVRFAYAGRPLRDLDIREKTGASVIAIDRQGYRLDQIGPDTQLFPGDRLLLLGKSERIRRIRKQFFQVQEDPETDSMESVLLESVRVSDKSPLQGKRLVDLQWPRNYKVQVTAIRRDDQTILSPTAETKLEVDDELLLIGPDPGIREIQERM